MTSAIKNLKPIPKSILIFGAANHIGKPMAKFLQKEAPDIKLRLVSTDEERAESLKNEFPTQDVAVANLLDPPSLEKAVDGIEGFYLVAPPWVSPEESMTNFVTAVKKSGTAVHIVRQTAMMPGYNYRLLPKKLKEMMAGEYPDLVTKRILDESDLPVTYANFGATFMDNIIYQFGKGIREQRKMIWHHRKVPFIDPRDIAEIVARLLLSDNHRHIGLLHTINNGHDFMRWSDVAVLMSEVYGEPIEYVHDKDAFIEANATVFGPMSQMLWDFFEWEESYEEGWALNDFAERMLGRKPTTMREWLVENKAAVLG